MNKHPATGIAYGIIALEKLDQDIVDILLYGASATNLNYEAGKGAFLANARSQAQLDEIEFDEQRAIDAFNDEYDDLEPSIKGEHQSVKYMSTWLGGAPMLWVLESPMVSLVSACSPCCPDAGDLHTPNLAGIAAYDVYPDWRAK